LAGDQAEAAQEKRRKEDEAFLKELWEGLPDDGKKEFVLKIRDACIRAAENRKTNQCDDKTNDDNSGIDVR